MTNNFDNVLICGFSWTRNTKNGNGIYNVGVIIGYNFHAFLYTSEKCTGHINTNKLNFIADITLKNNYLTSIKEKLK